jgi:hypothetical protein
MNRKFGKNENSKSQEKNPSAPMELGIRKISSQNFSKIVTLPKHFVNSSPFGEFSMVKMTMLEDGSLKLTPVRQNDESDVFSAFKP